MVRGIVQHVSNIRGWGANRLKARWRSVTALLASEITIFNLFTRKKKFFLISFPPKFPPTTCKLANRAGGRIKTVHWLPSWFRQLATAAILGACFAWGMKKKKRQDFATAPQRKKKWCAFPQTWRLIGPFWISSGCYSNLHVFSSLPHYGSEVPKLHRGEQHVVEDEPMKAPLIPQSWMWREDPKSSRCKCLRGTEVTSCDRRRQLQNNSANLHGSGSARITDLHSSASGSSSGRTAILMLTLGRLSARMRAAWSTTSHPLRQLQGFLLFFFKLWTFKRHLSGGQLGVSRAPPPLQ